MSFNYYHIRTDDFNAHAGGGHEVVITRDNYEAYFVMYVDDELNATERNAVEQFIAENPDLDEEMVMLQQSVLRADDHIVFEQKELLFKSTGHTPVNENNCEQYFVQYGDDELTNAEKEKVEQFVFHHPRYQADFELLQQVKLVPDNSISFPDKTYLYRTEEDDNRVIAFPWWRFTAAAIAILVIGTLAWHIANNTGDQHVAQGTRATESTNGNSGPQSITPKIREGNETTEEKNLAINETPAPVNTTTGAKQPEGNEVARNNKKIIPETSNKPQPSYVKQESTPVPEQDPEITDIAIAPKRIDVPVDNSERPIVKSTVAELVPVHTIAANIKTENEPDQSLEGKYILTAPVSKTPLRGFFRKVSRVVEKVTNPEENGKRGVRIANLEFALN